MYYRLYTDKKENQIFLIYKKIQNGAVAKGFLIYAMYVNISPYMRIEEAVSHI
jgi:hypothetical protein